MELQPGHESMYINIETESVTLNFEIGVWFFLVTRRLDNYAIHFFPCIRELQTRHERLHFYIYTTCVTLTWKLVEWFTHCLDMANTSAKLYGNPFMQYKVMARTQKPMDAQMDRQMERDGQCDFNMPWRNLWGHRARMHQTFLPLWQN